MPNHAHLGDTSRGRPSALGVLILGLWMAHVGPAMAQAVEQTQVEAAYLYNFAKFVEWPPETFRDPEGRVLICVVGDEHVSSVLEKSLAGKKVNQRPVEARNPHASADLKPCHIVFIAYSDRERIAETLKELRGLDALTVGRSSLFLPLGGMINLAFKHDTIELEIDLEASNAVGLKISSRLLVVARLVKARPAGGGEP